MFCFPLDKKPDWRRPPVITLLLILVNVMCFTGFQLDDGEEAMRAHQYYFESGLNKIELPHYYDYAVKTYDFKQVNEMQSAKNNMQKEEFEYGLASRMFNDGVFMAKLRNGDVITEKDPDYQQWRSLRLKVDKKWNEITYYRFGLKPAQPDLFTYISSMFLHGGFQHLFWNMVFLFLFGFIVEKAIGWKIYLPAYIVAGIGSGLLFVVIESDSLIPGIGASGAIAGLAGMYTVLFGLRKVRFFVFLFFYFDTVRLPAIIMLPVWILYEFYNHFFAASSVNNLAHAGGYITGAVIIALLKVSRRQVNEDYLDDEQKQEEFHTQSVKAQQYLAAMEFDKARNIFVELEKKQPDNIDLKRNLFNIGKLNPAGEDFHKYAKELLSLTDIDVQTVKDQREVFVEYISRAKPGPRLNPLLLTRLAIRFAKRNYIEEAEKIVHALLKNKFKGDELSDVLVLLVNNFRKTKPDRAKRYLMELSKRAPEKAQQLID